MLSEEDWIADEYNDIDVSFVKTQLNCFDESALEMMLKLSDFSESFNVMVELDALTIGNQICENYLKTLYALGYKRAVRIECEEELRFWPELTAGLIAEYVSQIGSQDVVIMGNKSADGSNGKVPLLMAEHMRWPCITQVIGMELVDETCLKVEHVVDGGSQIQMIRTPCVLAIGNAPESYLRVPTLKDRMKLGKQPIEVYTPKDLQVSTDFLDLKPMTHLVEISSVDHSREGIIIRGETAKEKAEELYQSYLKERLDKI